MLYLGKNAVVPAITVSGGEVTSVITAINETSSDILKGDKVWINQENGENKLVDYYKNGISFSNFDVYGQLTFDAEKKVVKNFSSSNYIQLQTPFNPENNTWEIVLKVKTPNVISRVNYLLGGINSFYNTGVAVELNSSGHFGAGFSSNGSSWDISWLSSPTTVSSNTIYWVKVEYTGTQYILYLSTNGVDYTIEAYVDNTTSIYTSNELLETGSTAKASNYWLGEVYFDGCYIKVNNEIWWQPYEQGIQKQLSRDILMANASSSDYFIDNGGIYKPFIYSKSAYPFINKVFKPGNRTWKLITKIKTPSDDQINNYNVLFCGQNSFYNTGFEVCLGDTHKLQFGVGDGSNWTIAYIFGSKVFDVNTIYWLKFEFNGSRYSLSYSLDGENYIEDCYVDSTTAIGNSGSALISIGYRDSTRYWRGEIDLSETNIEVDGKLWNDASETLTNITSATQTGIAAESIAASSTGLVNVGAVIEPTGSITITENGTHNIADYAEAVVNVPVPVVDKYKVGDRVNDDSNNPVGTVSGIKTDGNGQRYAVICLDGSYRGNGQYHSTRSEITGLPSYANRSVWSNKETATNNTQKILDYASSQGTSSSACNLCRAASFIINDVTYHGQFPTVDELVDIFKNMDIINSQDTSGINAIPVNGDVWSSTQCGSSVSWMSIGDGAITNYYMDSSFFVIPVLEIPLDD